MAKLTLTNLAGGYLSIAAVNANHASIITAMDNTLSRDGTVPNVMNANIDMNSIGRIVNLKDAVANQEPVTLAQAGSLLAITTTSFTQDNVAAVLWPQSALETTNSATATELQYYYGNVERFGAKLDGSTDDTASFNNAIKSGYEAYVDHGTAAITGTILIKAAQTLRCDARVILQRFAGAATTPIIHMYGNMARFFGNGCVIRQNLYDHPSGIILFGPAIAETASGTTDVQCYNMQFWDAKIVGPENTGPNAPIQLGSPGFYVHSLKRKGSGFNNPTYKCSIGNLQILNCDILLMFSTDANSNRVTGFYGHQWIKHAILFNAAYGNIVTDIMLESPLADTTAKRYAVFFGSINGTNETGSDAGYAIDSAFRNNLTGYAELASASGNINVAFFNHEENGTVFGHNHMHIVGNTAGAGIGRDGLSDAAAMGTNTFRGADTFKVGLKGEKFSWMGWEIRTMDDATGSYFSKDGNVATIVGREVAIAEGITTSCFSLEGLGPNTVAAFIEVSYVAKADTVASGQVGKVIFAVWQETTSTYFVRKLWEVSTSFDETEIVRPTCTVGVGDVTTEMKAIFKFTTATPAGTNLFHITWEAKLISTETSANADLDDNIHIL